jgi:prepilin-type N-terminal cleavage/methylation domain-containing protein
MKLGMRIHRKALTLIEVLIALAVLACLAGSLIDALSTGHGNSTHAQEFQMGVLVSARTMDQIVARGYSELASAGAGMLTSTVDSDGVRFVAVTRVKPTTRGLLRLEMMLTWESPGATRQVERGPIVLVRYVADPLVGMEFR